MPWSYPPKKDAHGCEKRRLGATIRLPGGVRMGKPGLNYMRSTTYQIFQLVGNINMWWGTTRTETS